MKLQKYLELYSISPTNFAALAGISMPTVYNVLNGRDITLSVAFKIQEATNECVQCKDMINDKILNRVRTRKSPKKKKIKAS